MKRYIVPTNRYAPAAGQGFGKPDAAGECATRWGVSGPAVGQAGRMG